MKGSHRAALAALFCLCMVSAHALDRSSLEETVCGVIKERLAFFTWSSIAGKLDESVTVAGSRVIDVSHVTTDGRTLRGYRYAPPSSVAVKGVVLFAQGNAMRADEMLDSLQVLADAGYEVLVYDFRGYGRSDGTPRLKAIVSDYKELLMGISTSVGKPLFLYGVSFGGLALLNAMGAATPSLGVRGVVIDSTPSTVSDQGCPDQYDPLKNLPAKASSMLLIVGGKDPVVPPGASRALAQAVEEHGGKVDRQPEFSHPFMDSSQVIHAMRLSLVTSFFDSKLKE